MDRAAVVARKDGQLGEDDGALFVEFESTLFVGGIKAISMFRSPRILVTGQITGAATGTQTLVGLAIAVVIEIVTGFPFFRHDRANAVPP